MFMKWSAIGFWATLTELLAHFLSLSWGFAMLVVAFVWTAGVLRATGAKAATTEQRVTALVPQVGNALSTANNALPKAGGTVTGSLTVNGDHLIGGSLYGSGFGTVHIGNSLSAGGNIGASNFGGSYFGGQGSPGGYPLGTGVSISPTTSGFANLINSIIQLCQNAGLM